VAKRRHNMAQFDGVAQRVTDRAFNEFGLEAEEGFGIDPVTIGLIFTNLIPMILNCFQKNDEVPAAEVYGRVRKMNQRNPRALKKRLRRSIIIQSQKDGVILTDDQIEKMSDAVIAEAMAATEDEVYSLSQDSRGYECIQG